MKLSIVTTLYRTEAFVDEFHRRISEQAKKITEDYEIIMVDDGSPDRALEIAVGIVSRDPRVSVIELSRNFGHHRAIMTGLEHARGNWVFLIDSDLEEPPELLESFHRTLTEDGWDVVYGYQEQRKGGLLERFTGRLAWWLLDALLPVRVPLNHSTVRLMTREYVRCLVQHKEQKTAVGGLWVITGFKQKGTPFRKLSRGVSSYTFCGRLLMLLDSVTSFSEKPLYGIFYLGIMVFILSVLFAIFLVIKKIFGQSFPGWISVMVSIWMVGGIIIASLGVIGLYLSRIFIETKNRPYTLTRKIHGPLASE